MPRIIFSLTTALALGAAVNAPAQTVTVAPAGADFNSVKAAVDSFAPTGANNGIVGDNVINITQGGTYVETGALNLVENDSYTIQCTDAGASATLVITPGSAGGGTSLIGATASSQRTYRFQNLVVLPAYIAGTGATVSAGEGIRLGHGGGSSATLVMKDVFIGPNNGSNAPATNGLASATGNFTVIGGSGVRLLGGVTTLTLENLTATHCATWGVYDNGDIVLTNGVPSERSVGAGTKLTYNGNGGNTGGYNLGAAGLTGITGTAAAPVIIAYNNGHGLYINSNPNLIYGDVNYLHLISNKSSTDTDASGLSIAGLTLPNNSRFYKAIIAGNGSGSTSWGNISASNIASPTLRFDQCTIFDAASDQPALRILPNTGSGGWLFTDSIIAGTGDYLYSTETDVPTTFTNCAIVTMGPDALNASVTPGANEVYNPTFATLRLVTYPDAFTFNNTTFLNPQFSSYNPASPAFLDVSNPAYATVSSTNGPLSGGADYNPAPASILSWSVY